MATIDDASLKLAREEREPGPIHAGPIVADLESLPDVIFQRIQTETFNELREPLWLFLKLTVMVSRDTWKSIRFLGTEKLEGGREIETVYAIPPLSRTLLDSLLTLIYVFDDKTMHIRAYYAGAWRNRYEEHQRMLKEYGADSAWKNWFELSEADLEQVARLAGVTDDERAATLAKISDPNGKNTPGVLRRWPNPGKLGNKEFVVKDESRLKFMRFLNEWLYGTLSEDSHLTFSGLVRRGGIYAPLAAGVDVEKNKKLARSQFLFEALSLYLAVLSEISSGLGFEPEKARLRRSWERLAAWPDAEQFTKKRYDALLR